MECSNSGWVLGIALDLCPYPLPAGEGVRFLLPKGRRTEDEGETMKLKYPKYYNASKATFADANFLRKNQTSSEKRMWEILRNRQIKKLKFRRQHPIGPYIVDFYCDSTKLVIELDGLVHDLIVVKERDESRQEYLESLGLTVLRFKNEDVFEIPERIVEIILSRVF